MYHPALLELVTDQLRGLYDAEKQLTKALPRIAKTVEDEELAEAFRNHAVETQEQARRLESIFADLGMKPRSKPCEAMKALLDEGQTLTGELDESVRDIALVSAGRRVEHYEMAGYEAIMAAAQVMKKNHVVELIRETLREEVATDKLLASIGKRLLTTFARSAKSDNQEPAPKSAHAKSGGSHSATTTDHDEIRRWAEERGGKPACVMGTGGKGDIGLLRIEFPGAPNANDDKLSELSWDEFFEKFDERGLALVFQEKTADGKTSNFNKLISRESEAKPKTHGAH